MNEEYEYNFRKSVKSVKFKHFNSSVMVPSRTNLLIQDNRKQKIIKSELDEKLLKLFSSQPSPRGYNKDIQSLLKDLHLSKQDLFKIVLKFLSKSTKKENELRIIASYLFSMQGLTNLLLKSIDLNESNTIKEKQLLNNLLVLGNILGYEKFPKNSILIRFGEKGSNAYLNLLGDIAVLIKKSYRLLLDEDEYLNYLVNLIRYKEYELANLTINDNYKIFPIEIIDDIKEEDPNKRFFQARSLDNFYKINNYKIFNNSNSYILDRKSSRYITNFNITGKSIKLDKIKSKNQQKLKLNMENQKLKELSSQRKIYASKLMEKFNLKAIKKKSLNTCSIEDYINRLNSISGFNFDENEYNKNLEKSTDRTYFTIYSYMNIVNLPAGSLFGELALSNKNSIRTATIIALNDCYCGVLNKNTYDKCVKNGAEKNLHDILNFIVELPIFKGIPQSIFYRKYFTSLSRNSVNKSSKIIVQGDKPSYLTLLKSGEYIIYIYNSLYNITNLMTYYMTLSQKIKKNDETINKIILSLKSTNKLLIANEKFRNYYFSKNNFKVGEISCPDIIGYNEYLDEDGKYAFSIESKSIQSDFFLLKNDFYEDIMNTNKIVKINQEEMYFSKLNVILERLYNMRRIAIKSFMEYKTDEKISTVVTKEIDDYIGKRIKFKRLKKLNSTNFKIPLIQKDINNSENIFLGSLKKSGIISNSQSKNKMSTIISKEISKTENNINTKNNKLEKENTFLKDNKFLELLDSNNSFNSNNLPIKNNINNYNNRTITYFNNHNSKHLNRYLKNKIRKHKKEKIEMYSQKEKNIKKKDFDGVCLNNMILEDIKEQIKFPLYESSSKKQIFAKNKNKRKKMLLISQKLYNSIKNNKYEYNNSLPSLQEEYIKSSKLFTIGIKNNKITETNNKKSFSNNLVVEEKKNNYRLERSKYYENTISKRLNYFFGNKNKIIQI